MFGGVEMFLQDLPHFIIISLSLLLGPILCADTDTRGDTPVQRSLSGPCPSMSPEQLNITSSVDEKPQPGVTIHLEASRDLWRLLPLQSDQSSEHIVSDIKSLPGFPSSPETNTHCLAERDIYCTYCIQWSVTTLDSLYLRVWIPFSEDEKQSRA